MTKHLVFYDGACGLCDRTVQFLLKVDKEKIFVFAPLQGETAKKTLSDLPDKYCSLDTLILVENYDTTSHKFYVLGKAVLRISWLLGGFWALIGWLNFLPSFLADAAYRLVARNRHFFFPNDVCILPQPEYQDRFLH